MMKLISPCILLMVFISCQTESVDPGVDHNWAEYQGDPGRNQYRSHDQINRENVSALELRWQYHAGDLEEGSQSQIQCNPLIIDGILYGTSPKLTLFAIDAATGEEIWKFDPVGYVDKKFGTGVNRGLAFHASRDQPRILYTVGPNLFAINIETGRPISSFGLQGVVDLKKGLDRDIGSAYFGNNTPGAIFEDLIILGGRTSEGADHAPGHIRAFDVYTGERKWIFHTIPFPDEFGYETWPDSAYLSGGGANAWSGFSVDHDAEIVYASTGSASFDFYGGDRPGKNLFANCIIALNANTGERIWHFQARHHDLWDRDFPAPPNLITVKKDGAEIKALAQITKSGDLFVFNRITGESLYPIEEVSAPSSTLEGEMAWPTQPVPTGYPKYTRDYLTEKDLAKRSVEAHQFAQEAWQAADYGEFVPPSLKPQILFPGMDGGGEWGGAAYDPKSGLMYINSNELTWRVKMNRYAPTSRGQSIYQTRCQVCHAADLKGSDLYGNIPSLVDVVERLDKEEIKATIMQGKGIMPAAADLQEAEVAAVIRFLDHDVVDASEVLEEEDDWPYPYVFDGYAKYLAPDGLPIITPPWGQLTAINMHTAEIKWQIPFGNIDSLDIAGHPITGTENYGGPVVTAGGLLFIAATADEKFRVFDKDNGALLWEYDLPTGGYATPATYLVDEKQYVVIACGGGKLGSNPGDVYLAFGLPD